MKNCDLHTHTTVSDGDLKPEDVIAEAERIGLESIAITDHDALDAHKVLEGQKNDVLKIITGIEIDCSFGDNNIEILGYYIDIHNAELNDYLTRIQSERRKRAQIYIERLNEHYGNKVLKEEDVFKHGRVTILKPHILIPMINTGIFRDYGEAKAFISSVPDEGFSRADSATAVNMIKSAGGMAVLAHPGVYPITFNEIERMLHALKTAGLDGVETYYPYRLHMPERYKDKNEEALLIKKVERLAASLKLEKTAGTDSHRAGDLEKYNREIKEILPRE